MALQWTSNEHALHTLCTLRHLAILPLPVRVQGKHPSPQVPLFSRYLHNCRYVLTRFETFAPGPADCQCPQKPHAPLCIELWLPQSSADIARTTITADSCAGARIRHSISRAPTWPPHPRRTGHICRQIRTRSSGIRPARVWRLRKPMWRRIGRYGRRSQSCKCLLQSLSSLNFGSPFTGYS